MKQTREVGVMKIDLGAAEFGLAVLVCVISIGGSFAASQVRVAENTVRIEHLEESDKSRKEWYARLNETLLGVNVTLGRVDERLKHMESRNAE